jgi:hypothetical protein
MVLEKIPFSEGYVRGTFDGEIIEKEGESTALESKGVKLVKSFLELYEEMGELSVGEAKEVLCSTTEKFILIRLFPNKKEWAGVVLTKDGNLGFTRYILKEIVEGGE